MTQASNLTSQPIDYTALIKRMLIGGMIGLLLISFFVFQVDNPDPAWGKLWRIRPLVITPLGAAAGGAFYYLMDYVTYQGGWRRTLANILSFIVFIIGLWLSFVLGLAGTLWH